MSTRSTFSNDIGDGLLAEASPTLRRFADRIASSSGPLIDLACGEGRHTALFVDMGCDAIGVDVDGKRLEKANERLDILTAAADQDRRRSSYRFMQVDLNDETWPLEEAAFGAALIVHHYSAHVVGKALKLLRRGGVFFLETYGGNGGNWRALPRQSFVRQLLDDNAFDIEFYKERKVGPTDIDAVSVRTVAVRR